MTDSTSPQRIVRVPGGRRVRLTAVPGSTGEPVPADARSEPPRPVTEQGPNDAQLRRDVPPHY